MHGGRGGEFRGHKLKTHGICFPKRPKPTQISRGCLASRAIVRTFGEPYSTWPEVQFQQPTRQHNLLALTSIGRVWQGGILTPAVSITMILVCPSSTGQV